jgi:predicted 2-oxoglutarate/Fe(II)-dependent dioxygenase YbiX
MNATAEYFERNGYVVLKDVLSLQKCQELTEHMFELHRQGKLVNDDQCPLSDAVYGDPVFDTLLQNIAEPLGKAVGKRLLPTYSYARIYRPGDVLKKHKDRPACEISTTLTLGYDAKQSWPIAFANDDYTQETSVSMEPGEMAAYKGCELIHWRKPFKGNWHVQVFLHYVDADGPYADQAMDGRSSFGVDKTQETLKYTAPANTKPAAEMPKIKVHKPLFDAVIIPGKEEDFPGYFAINSETLPNLMFTDAECERIINIARESYSSTAGIGGGTTGTISKQIRSAEIFNVENTKENRWIFEKVANTVSVANAIHFDYDLSGITHSLQLIHYSADFDVPGHYNWHVDAGPGHPASRKISFTAQLTDPTEYKGCDLEINNHGELIKAVRERGSISLFPSYMPHVVTPIESGDRYALVIWIHGPRRFR